MRATAVRRALAKLGGPKGLAWWRDSLYVADTENHVIRQIELKTGSSAPCWARVSAAMDRNPIPVAVRWPDPMACSWTPKDCCTLATARPTGFEPSD